MNRQGVTYTIIFTFVVSFLFVTLLALANDGTADRVARNQILARQRAVLNAFTVPYQTEDEVASRFADVKTVTVDGQELYLTTVEGREVYAKEFRGSGLWGEINGILSITSDLQRTVGMEILTHNETPGLGGRIDETWFKRQLEGEQLVNGTITVGEAGDGDEDHSNGSIDAITGASRTSDSMRTILNAELSELRTLLGGNS